MSGREVAEVVNMADKLMADFEGREEELEAMLPPGEQQKPELRRLLEASW